MHAKGRPQETVNSQGVHDGCRDAEKTVRKPAGQQGVKRREEVGKSREERASERREESEVSMLESGQTEEPIIPTGY